MITFPEGQTRFEYNITITPDSIVENNEMFKIQMTVLPGNRAIVDPNRSESTITINDDDSKIKHINILNKTIMLLVITLKS